jgi:ribonuclease P protein component
VLAKANRIALPADFRSVVRRGRRMTTPSAVYYRLATEPDRPVRFGFIVSRAVGNAVDRNRLRRRLRALGRGYVDAGRRGEDVVVRALPGAAQRDWGSLSADMRAAFDSPLRSR